MEAGPLEPGPDAPDSSSLIAVFIRIDVRKPRRFLPPCGGRSILFGTRLVYGACAPSPPGGGRAGWRGDACYLTLPPRGGGDPVEPSAQDWCRTRLGRQVRGDQERRETLHGKSL